jgi:hypothetical protein
MQRLYRLAVAASFVAIAFAGLAMLRSLQGRMYRPPLSAAEFALFIGALVIVAHVILAVHELGHIAGGRLAGLRFQILIVGPLRIAREDGRIRAGVNREIAHYGGLAGSDATGSEATARQLAITAAAGPIASVLFGALAAAATGLELADRMAVSAHVDRFIADRSIAVLAAGSMVVGLANLVPARFGTKRSDGARLVELWRDARANTG